MYGLWKATENKRQITDRYFLFGQQSLRFISIVSIFLTILKRKAISSINYLKKMISLIGIKSSKLAHGHIPRERPININHSTYVPGYGCF